jgi:endonuclease/exonuclease/phosphatase (EEP) superfamily protein YafD
MRYGQADPAALARLVRSQRPDIVVLLEAQPQSVAALAGAGVGGPSSPWHFHGGTPGPWITGTVVLSRWPVEQQRRLDILTGAWAMRIAAPQPFTLVAVHTSQPLSRRPLWLRDFGVLRATVPRLRGPALVAGDFNATLDHGPMRSLLGEGLTDAARQADSGMQETWPAPGVSTLVPRPMIAIDHVLTNRGFSAISTQTHVVPGTDHLALGVRLARR